MNPIERLLPFFGIAARHEGGSILPVAYEPGPRQIGPGGIE